MRLAAFAVVLWCAASEAHAAPDGHYIAFTGQYGGDEQVYVMPADGGVPRQLTPRSATKVGRPTSYTSLTFTILRGYA